MTTAGVVLAAGAGSRMGMPKALVRDADGELTDGPDIRFPVHELCHARQVLDWGTLRYLARHIRAWIQTRSILAKSAPEEVPCYEAQEAAEASYT